MPLDEDPDDERPLPDRLLPPDDRLWRHPSEVDGGIGRSVAPAAPGRPARRTPARTALAGACLAGAVVAVGAMWIARPTRVVERDLGGSPVRAAAPTPTVQSATFIAGPVPTEALAEKLAPTVARLRVLRDGTWSNATALWIDDRGTLAAAAPLVSGASQMVAIGHDGTSSTVRLAGVDDATGVAALVADRTSGSPVKLSRAAPETGGQAAVVGANGTDAGEDNGDATMAGVIIRSLSLRVSIDDLVIHDAIQLDREVPADALGGALVDVDGDLLGMVVGNSRERGLGAVIPGETVMATATDLRDRGKVRRAWLGVRAVDLDPVRASLMQVAGGAHLTEVTPDSPAAGAGLEKGDVITAVDDHDIDDASDLVNSLGDHQPGDRAVVEFRRSSEAHDATVTLRG